MIPHLHIISHFCFVHTLDYFRLKSENLGYKISFKINLDFLAFLLLFSAGEIFCYQHMSNILWNITKELLNILIKRFLQKSFIVNVHYFFFVFSKKNNRVPLHRLLCYIKCKIFTIFVTILLYKYVLGKNIY